MAKWPIRTYNGAGRSLGPLSSSPPWTPQPHPIQCDDFEPRRPHGGAFDSSASQDGPETRKPLGNLSSGPNCCRHRAKASIASHDAANTLARSRRGTSVRPSPKRPSSSTSPRRGATKSRFFRPFFGSAALVLPSPSQSRHRTGRTVRLACNCGALRAGRERPTRRRQVQQRSEQVPNFPVIDP